MELLVSLSFCLYSHLGSLFGLSRVPSQVS